MRLPEGLYLSDVYLEDHNCVAFGGYADIRIGYHQGTAKRVALKTVRTTHNTDGASRDNLKVRLVDSDFIPRSKAYSATVLLS